MTAIAVQIDIDASSDRVWQILAELDRYADWNPFTPRVDSDRIVGHPIVLHVDFSLGSGAALRPQREVLRVWEPGRELRWGMTMGPAWWFRAERWQRVVVTGNSRCRYETEDRFDGAFAPVVVAMYGAKVRRGFEAVAAGLKRAAES